jgi:predicted AlkP superfamily pyrophosphatase or phosphodiesterase
MPDLSAEILPRLVRKRLPGFDLGDDYIYPQYEGYSILNIPASICQLLGVPELNNSALASELLIPLGDGIQRVILVLVDALSFLRLRKWMTDGTVPLWGRLAEQGIFTPLTTLSPSTTSSALTTLWTGASPAQHGIVGYEMWLKEYSVVANTILQTPMTFKNDVGGLKRAGFKPREFMNQLTLGMHLARHGIGSYAFQHYGIIRSGLSQMFFEDVKTRAFSTHADLWVNLRSFLESNLGERLYAWVYWGQIDHFSHHYGPDDERTIEEFVALSNSFERLLLERLSSAARRDTVLILTADHGQIATPLDPIYEFSNHPELESYLHILPTGENRQMSLFVRPGKEEQVRNYFTRTWPGKFTILNPDEVINAGLLGPGERHPRLFDRLGDMMVFAHDNAYLWWSKEDNFLLGRHGGLSPEEMLVPYLAVRF